MAYILSVNSLGKKRKKKDRELEQERKEKTHRNCDARQRHILCTNKEASTPANVLTSGLKATNICV